MEVLNYKSEMKKTLFAYLKNKTAINPKQIEDVFTTFANNEKFLNFSEEKSAKITELHSQFVELMETARLARVKVTSTKSLHTKASKKLAANPNDQKALERMESAAEILPEVKRDFMEKVNPLIECLIELDKELKSFVADYNKANPENPFEVQETSLATVKQTALVPYNMATPPATLTVNLVYLTDASEEKLEEVIVTKAPQETPVKEEVNEPIIVTDFEDLTNANNETPEHKQDDGSAKFTADAAVDNNIPALEEHTPEATVVTDPAVDADSNNNDAAPNGDSNNNAAPVDNAADANNQQEANANAENVTPKEESKKEEKPAEKKEDKKEEKKKPEKDKSLIFPTTLGFLVAVIACALMIAGVGVAGVLLPALAVSGSAVAILGKSMGEFEYVIGDKTKKEKQPKANKKTKSKEKDKTSENSKVKNKKKSKEKNEFVAEPYIPEKNNEDVVVTETPKTNEKNAEAEAEKTPVKASINADVKKETMQTLETITSTTANEAEYAASLDHLYGIAQTVNPDNKAASAFVDEDKDLAQDFINFTVEYNAFKSATKTDDNATESEEYSQETVNEISKQINSTVNHMYSTLQGLFKTEAQPKQENVNEAEPKKEEPKTTAPKKPKTKPTQLTQVKKSNKTFDKAVEDLRTQLNQMVKNKASNIEDYINIVNSCYEISEILSGKQNLTPFESTIKSLCEAVLAHEKSRSEYMQKSNDLQDKLFAIEDKEASGQKIDENEKSLITEQLSKLGEESYKLSQAINSTINSLDNVITQHYNNMHALPSGDAKQM